MGTIVISTNSTLDGVVQDPDGEEGFRLGGWFGRFGGADLEAWAKVEYEEALGADALLLGRRSDAWFAARWSSRPGEWADRLNGLPKYVVSSTLVDPRWQNATVLTGDVVAEVSSLKQSVDGEILVYASYQLGRTLIEHDLVDELRLVVFPVVLGAGQRLFGEAASPKPMRLVETRNIGDGLLAVTYEFARVVERSDGFQPRAGSQTVKVTSIAHSAVGRDSFQELVEPFRAELHAHCYRMLGSVHDAEDALQDALLRAWRGLPQFEGRSSLRSWLYRIATNSCLRLIERRPKRVLPIDHGPHERRPRRSGPAAGGVDLDRAVSGRRHR